MERAGDLSWRTYSGPSTSSGQIFGTPKADNSVGATAGQETLKHENIKTKEQESIKALEHENIKTILISEISAGTDNSSEDEFVELYNHSDTSIDLTNWSLKKKNSNASSSPANLVSSSSFIGKIAPKSFFLIAHENYRGSKKADLIYSANSQNIAYSNNTILLYDSNDNLIDEVSYADIPKNGSIPNASIGNLPCSFLILTCHHLTP